MAAAAPETLLQPGRLSENDVSFDLSELMLDSSESYNFWATDLTSLEGSYLQSNLPENLNRGNGKDRTDAFLSSLKMDDSDDFLSFDSFHDILSKENVSSIKNSTEIDVIDENLNRGNGKDRTDAFLSSLKKDDSDDFLLFDSFHDILSKENVSSIKNSTEIDVIDGLDLSSIINPKTIDDKKEFSEETSDDEQIPDIDLSFCIKKNGKDAFSIDTAIPDSVDSGFHEMTAMEPKLISNIHDKNILFSDLYLSEKGEKIKSKQSLFSRALSAKPKVDQERLTKLKQIRKQFFKQFPSTTIDKMCLEFNKYVIC